MEMLPFKVTTKESGYQGYLVVAPDLITASMIAEKYEKNDLGLPPEKVYVKKTEEMEQILLLTAVKVKVEYDEEN